MFCDGGLEGKLLGFSVPCSLVLIWRAKVGENHSRHCCWAYADVALYSMSG
jgi:hypothetical protein